MVAKEDNVKNAMGHPFVNTSDSEVTAKSVAAQVFVHTIIEKVHVKIAEVQASA